MGYNSTMIFRVNSVILYVPVQMQYPSNDGCIGKRF